MTHRSRAAAANLATALTTAALTLAIALVASVVPSAAFAQASVSLQRNVTLYRAFYYDASDNLLHIEVVRNADGRFLQPLPLQFQPKPAPAAVPTEPGPAVLVGDKVRYAVYYGLEVSSQPRPMPGQRDVQSRPLAIERLSDADATRPIECASPPGDACLFPKMCHCGLIGSCCCY